VLYKVWDEPGLSRSGWTRPSWSIAKGEWFVSMECLFRGFDYALRGQDGSTRIVARNSQTAFLTKHLRAYGGKGVFASGGSEYQVGRLLRNIVFSGKGLVKNPANPESVIFADAPVFVAAKAAHLDFSQAAGLQVYSPSDQSVNQTKESQAMALEVNDLQKQLDEARAQIESLKSGQHASELNAARAAKDKAEADLAAANQKLAEATKAVEASVAAVSEYKTKAEEAQKTLADVKDELKTIYAEQKKADRLTQLKAALKISEADAKAVANAVKLNDSLAALADEAFASYVTAQAEFITNNPASGNTEFPHGKAPQPPKATPAPNPPQTTSQPAPMAGKASEQDAGQENADTAALDAAQPDQAAAGLSAVPADAGVKDFQAAVAKFFGMDVSEGQS
jgi:hypothetical protein